MSMLTKNQAEEEIFGLLTEWCDGLLANQLSMPGRPEFDGGILCPACGLIHGRCTDALYPLLFMADRTGEEKYLTGARRLFAWGENMICDDGSMYNDAQNAWNGITVFGAVALCDALRFHGHMLEPEEKTAWERRMRRAGAWLFSNLRIGFHANINYYATNACAMALLGKYLDREDWLALARELLAYCLNHLTENGLLMGEGKPHDALTARGCRAIDVGGYNVEESLPSLCRAAEALGEEAALSRLMDSFRAHIRWMLPDGAWDNSVGTRVFKWTYWGSRTSDGCQEALFMLGRRDPLFAEAAWRSFTLYRACTHDGLLHGGPDYHRHGERPCVHHTFCHAKVLAGALDGGLYGFPRKALPADAPRGIEYWPELDTYRLSLGDWIADVTGCDFDYMPGGHASGGALTLLWHRSAGPLVAAGMTDYALHEITNQQLTRKKAEQKCTCPRIEAVIGGVRYAQIYDCGAQMSAEERSGGLTVHAKARLCDGRHVPLAEGGHCEITYTLTEHGLRIGGRVDSRLMDQARFVLPTAGSIACIRVEEGTLEGESVPMFNLNPGFMGREYRVAPDESGAFCLIVTAQ